MSATADPSTSPSCVGVICDGTCQPSFLNVLPCLFSSTSKAVAGITASNNAVKVAQIQTAGQVQQAQIKASKTINPTMIVLLGLGIILAIAFIK
jgi:hypothetical protein